ncbi:MAG: permease [Calditrichaeota bacterium]|nr:permease [Calditrichota bacterium]
MCLKSELKSLFLIVGLFAGFYFLPIERLGVPGSVGEALALTTWYAREHVILCLIPALFIAGAISTFVNSGAVMKHLGAGARKIVAYGVASVSGSVLAVCSCTVLPLFGGIYKMGAGLGPATAFLYAGPAINVLAIILTARILGMELGIARAVGAVLFSIVLGLLMAWIFRKEETKRAQAIQTAATEEHSTTQVLLWFATLTLILIAATIGETQSLYPWKWWITGAFGILMGWQMITMMRVSWTWILAASGIVIALTMVLPEYPQLVFLIAVALVSIVLARTGGAAQEWLDATWGFAKQILPLLLIGILVAGFLLGRPGHEGMIPSAWISDMVGGNSLFANLFAAVAGAFMYFATLTEVPILQGLLGSGMGQGPALTLLLAGPALSLPSMLVIRSILGTRKTIVFVILVIGMSAVTGWIYGMMV